MPPGEPSLIEALLQAARAHGARYVSSAVTGGWFISDVLPRDTEGFYRVDAKKIYARSADGHEAYFGRVQGKRIVQEATPDDVKYLATRGKAPRR